MRFIFFSIILIILNSCTSEQQQVSLRETAQLWAAQSFESENESIDTNGEKSEVLVLKFENLKKVNADYPKKYITSISAYKFLQNLAESEYSEYEYIKVRIKNNSTSFENTYKISDITALATLLKPVDSFFEILKTKELDNLTMLFDTTLVTIKNILEMKKVIQHLDSAQGKPQKFTFVGFDFKTTGKEKTPVMISHTYAEYKNSFSDYVVVLRIHDKKIIYFGMNEKSE